MRLPLALIFALVSCSTAAKIAVFFAPLSNSQVVFNIRFAEELANDHDVVLIRPNANPKSSKLVSSHPRVREIRSKGCAPELFQAFHDAEHEWVYGPNTIATNINVSKTYKPMFGAICESMALDPVFIAKLREEKFDFAFTHHLDFCSIGIIHGVGIPNWGWVLSTFPFGAMLHRVGMPKLPSIMGTLINDAPQRMSFRQRLTNFIQTWFFELYYHTAATTYHTETLRNAFGKDFPELAVLMEQGRMMVVNSNADIEFPIPVTSKVVFIGGLAQQQKIKPLEEPFASFIHKAKKVVLVSFGTVADSATMPQSWKDAFVHLFRGNPDINFIWKMDAEVEVPSNVLRVKWQPQNDILANDKVVAFITHAGYNSIGEVIASATPILTVPLFGDQHRNSHLAMFRHFGVRVDKDKISFETLNEAMHMLIDDPSYLAAAKEVQAVQNAAPLSPGLKLRSAVNFTLSHPNFDREVPRLYLFQLYSLDCMALLLGIVLVVLYVVYRILWCYYWSCCKMAYKEKVKLQ